MRLLFLFLTLTHTFCHWTCTHQTILPLGQTLEGFFMPSGKADIRQLVAMLTSTRVQLHSLMFHNEGFVLLANTMATLQ